MTYSKSASFATSLQEVALLGKVFAHPARLAILEFLATQKTCISGDIADHLPLSRTTVSQHLQELKNYGLIKGSVRGVKVSYCIDKCRWAEAKAVMKGFMEELSIKIESQELDDSACC